MAPQGSRETFVEQGRGSFRAQAVSQKTRKKSTSARDSHKDSKKAAAAREYLAEHEPGHYSMLHTSISPNMFNGGYQTNVIPSEARATLDVRALPDEDMDKFYALMRGVIWKANM